MGIKLTRLQGETPDGYLMVDVLQEVNDDTGHPFGDTWLDKWPYLEGDVIGSAWALDLAREHLGYTGTR